MTCKKKILICYSRAGGGHESMARSIDAKLKNHEVILLDIGSSNSLLSQVLSSGYVWLTEKFPLLWYVLSVIWKTKIGMLLTRILIGLNIHKKIKHHLETHNPDMVISTYYFVNHVVKTINPLVKTCTVVSDIFAVQPIWFYDKTENYIVMSPESKLLGLSCNIPEKNIFVCNPVYDEKYDIPVTPEALSTCAQELGITPSHYPQLLIIGGGSSMPSGYQLIKQIITLKTPCQIYIVCGRNVELKKRIESLRQNLSREHASRIHVIGFTQYVRELITMSDIIISKAGPGIMIESLSLKKPLLLYYYIWEQEKPNMEFIVKNKLGIYQPKIDQLAPTIDNLLTHANVLDMYRNNLKNYHLVNGTQEMLDHILNLLDQ
jgi:1,2-diacylglycerol 3-beta-galactosyltransferase